MRLADKPGGGAAGLSDVGAGQLCSFDYRGVLTDDIDAMREDRCLSEGGGVDASHWEAFRFEGPRRPRVRARLVTKLVPRNRLNRMFHAMLPKWWITR